MDASHSPRPEGGENAGMGRPEDEPASQRGRSFFLNLIARAAEALGSSGEDDAEEGDGLGAAFARSSPAERAMVANILRLQDMRIEDVMTPRADIVAVGEDASLPEVMEALRRGSLSRLPVFRETLDDPLGFVHLKDLALAYGVGSPDNGAEGFELGKHLRTALYVPASMRIAVLLQRMQAARVHMALVIDEFGGVDGLVTIEDLVEQIVGDIEDEHDIEEIDALARGKAGRLAR